jgi:hypothetical protein
MQPSRPGDGHPAPRALLRAAFSFPVFLSFALIALAGLTVRGRFNDPDLWWHLKMGQIVWATHSVPHTEIFSYTAFGHPWVPHEWLSELSIYAAYRFWAYSGLMLWLDTFTALLLVLLYALCSLYSGNAKISLLGGLIGWFFGTVGLAIRPLLIGHVLLVIELLFLELARRKDPRWLWGLPLLFAVWVNCHGSWFFGMLILVVTVGCSFLEPATASRRTLIASTLLSGLALICNPAGWHTVGYPLDALFHQHTGLSNVQEWLPLAFLDARAIVLVAIMAGLALGVAAKAVHLRWDEGILACLAAAMAIDHRRMLFVFGVVVAPIVCRVLAGCWESYDPARDLRVVNAFCMVLAATFAVIAFPGPEALAAQERAGNPVGAVAFIRNARLSGPMLNAYDFGGYLIWSLPEHKVFVDGRADVFDWTGVLDEFKRWSQLEEDPQILLKKYRIHFCVLETGSAIAHVMPYLPGWHPAFEDSMGSVFVHED